MAPFFCLEFEPLRAFSVSMQTRHFCIYSASWQLIRIGCKTFDINEAPAFSGAIERVYIGERMRE